jgi:major membrane immunogen (membrane-anchored lipoprotein)
MLIGISSLFSGCARNAKESVDNAEAGNVSEAHGVQDDYGWTPQIRLTFDGDLITEIYFDYINSEANKKSEDSTYIDNMKDKTGIGVDEAMQLLSEQLLLTQDPDKIDVVTGATQTSHNFIALAKQAYENYQNDKNQNNDTTVDTSETGMNADGNPNTGTPDDGNPNNDNTNPEDGGVDTPGDQGSKPDESGSGGGQTGGSSSGSSGDI